jgi:hypothetical protein
MCDASDTVLPPLHNILQINRLFLKNASMDALKLPERPAKSFDDEESGGGGGRVRRFRIKML